MRDVDRGISLENFDVAVILSSGTRLQPPLFCHMCTDGRPRQDYGVREGLYRGSVGGGPELPGFGIEQVTACTGFRNDDQVDGVHLAVVGQADHETGLVRWDGRRDTSVIGRGLSLGNPSPRGRASFLAVVIELPIL